MLFRRTLALLAMTSLAAVGLAACASFTAGPIGNRAVPQPSKQVDLQRYVGLWYEQARYENRFERDCEAVTAAYRALPNGMIEVVNSCHRGSVGGPTKVAEGRAKVMAGSHGAKLKVSFFGPFFGDYWVLDHADDYSWSIVGEPSGRYLWILTRAAKFDPAPRDLLQARAKALGYDTSLIRRTVH
jgi:apolipoprotein D and lipocalin family protein